MPDPVPGWVGVSDDPFVSFGGLTDDPGDNPPVSVGPRSKSAESTSLVRHGSRIVTVDCETDHDGTSQVDPLTDDARVGGATSRVDVDDDGAGSG